MVSAFAAGGHALDLAKCRHFDGSRDDVVYFSRRPGGNEMTDMRIATLLFTDVEGSTRLLGALGDGFVALIERQRAIVTAAATAHRGSGHPTGGDGCVFLFGWVSDAVAAAVEAQRALAEEPWPGGACVRVRMAIHAGEVTEAGDELFGMALH